MPAIIESVPNISEGRNQSFLNRLDAAFSTFPELIRYHRHSDFDHNRSVLTFIGFPEIVKSAVFTLFELSIPAIDLKKHKGLHPRIGAVDVVPFVPLKDFSISQCIRLSISVAEKIASKYNLPVYLYALSARQSSRIKLADIRRGQFEGLAEKMSQPEWKPDLGPSTPHPTAGATVIGARNILIAFNIFLETDRVEPAKQIAALIRESSGGLPAVQALGFFLSSYGKSQVSINLLDYKKTSPYQVFSVVKSLAEKMGIKISHSELVGMAPKEAFAGAKIEELLIRNFEPSLLFSF